MNVIQTIRQRRKRFLDALKENPEIRIRKTVEDIYPDRVHFIYELLQNAEDTGASEVSFTLFENRLVFEHNGRSFDEADIKAITGIGTGTKEDDDKIGRFGIGFKAVFAYTETPHVWSSPFAFKISDLVLPSELPLDSSIGDLTRFEFPFDSLKKSPSDAFSEVRSGLEAMSETTLLFLSHIQSICWQVDGESARRLLGIEHSEYHIETLKERVGKTKQSSHFLRFTRPAEGLEKQYIAIAFALDAIPPIGSFDATKELAAQFRIVPDAPGRVAVFFTAEKEASGLRFHLHAPFVPELSRASIKDTPSNEPLFHQLAELTANSLFAIRDLNLLNADFLAVLPNPNDVLPENYECIREAIVEVMNEQPLTPTYSKTHAPASQLLQARVSLKSLLGDKDIETLVNLTDTPPTWAIGAPRNSNLDRFLRSLAIRDWDIEQFVQVLKTRLDTKMRFDWETSELINGPDMALLEWLSSQGNDWHQKFYALLYDELKQYELSQFRGLCIVRLSSGKYEKGIKCYFPTEDIEEDPILSRVAKGTYTLGRNKADQEAARKFLEAVGVREVGEREQVESILNRRYSKDVDMLDKKIYENDLRQFIALVENDPSTPCLFKDYWIFQREDGKWGQPNHVYLDLPHLDTGLRAYYESFEIRVDEASPVEIGCDYLNLEFRDNFLTFSEAVGVQTKLSIEEQSTGMHKMAHSLRQDYYEGNSRWTNTAIDSDWTIYKLDSVLENPSEELSRLIWHTMIKANKCVLDAKFRPNQQYTTRVEPSSLVLTLRQMRWVPQRDGYSRPAEASQSLLPEGFPFDSGWLWLKAVRFGAESAERNEERRKEQYLARELGFSDNEALRDAKRFAQLPRDIRRRILENQEVTEATELPDGEPNTPKQRARRVSEEAKNAPERVIEKRSRSISVNLDAVKENARLYLRQQYTNLDGVMICQVCKKSLPFTLSDGSYFFEAVEFLPELEKHHYQNYLTLCPNHAAMYQHANDDEERIKDLFLDLAGNELEVILAREDKAVYFTKTHMADLRAVIAAEDDNAHGTGDFRRSGTK